MSDTDADGAGSTTKKRLSDLTDSEIFAILLAHLHIKYDHGGYSLGRSTQSDAIEFRHLIPHCGFARDYAGNLDEEIAFRLETAQVPSSAETQATLELGASSLTTAELIQLCLKDLIWWYDNHAKESGFLDTESPTMVRQLLALHIKIHGDIPAGRPSSQETLLQLISEIRERNRQRLEAEHAEYDYALLIRRKH